MLGAPEYFEFVEKESHIFAIPAAFSEEYVLLSERLNLIRGGLHLGERKGKAFLPAHELALSIDKTEVMPQLNLTQEQALRFLKKEEFGPRPNQSERGFVLAAYEGLGLGWLKAAGNRYNNNLPKHLRIRKAIP